jgi:hypothetical protein
MKRILAAFGWIMFMAGFAALPAWSDTDYRCLNLCTHDGGAAANCMPQCTYNQAQPGQKPSAASQVPTANSAPSDTSTTHNAVVAPLPVGDQLVLPQSSVASKPASEDYRCVAACLKTGIQYQLCKLRCTDTCVTKCIGGQNQTYELCSERCPIAAPGKN